jgi:hypothetical protein
MQEAWMDQIIGNLSDVEIMSPLTPENFINAEGAETVFGQEVSQLLNLGWTPDIENSMLVAPEALEGGEALLLVLPF